MGAGGGDLERPLGVGLAADVGEIDVVGRGRRCPRGCSRGLFDLAVEEGDRLAERGGGEGAHPVDGRGLGAVADGDEQRPDPALAAGERDCERPAHGLDLPVERQLADDGEGLRAPLEETRRGEDAEGDRQVERRALLAQVGGSEVDSDAVGGKREAGVADGRAHALAALADGGVGGRRW